MKKRMCILCLIAVVVFTSVPSARADSFCFIGINDSIPAALPGDMAPYYDNGVLYVPYQVFESSPGGVIISYDIENGSFVLFTRTRRLAYDLEAGTVTDKDGNTSRCTPVFRGGVLYIPAVQAAGHFGLSISLLTSKTGCPILRFMDGSQVYDNKQFLEKAEKLVDAYLQHSSRQEQNGSEQGPKDEEEDPFAEEEEPSGPATVYLLFTGEAVNLQTLQILKKQSLQAAFFLTEQQILEDKDLVRAIYAEGHTIGLAAENEEELLDCLERANQALDETLFFRSILALTQGNLDDVQYRIINEHNLVHNLEEVLSQPELPHLFVYRTADYSVLQRLLQEKAFLPQLLDTSTLG